MGTSESNSAQSTAGGSGSGSHQSRGRSGAGPPNATGGSAQRRGGNLAPASQYQDSNNRSPNPQQQQSPPGGTGAGGAEQSAGAGAAANINNNNDENDRVVEEGQMIKMLATIETSTVSYNEETQILKFYVTSACPSVTYEIHTGVKEVVENGLVHYLPNKPKVEPTPIRLRGPQDNREVTVKLDVSTLEDREKAYNKHYPRQLPCAIVLRYTTSEVKPDGKGETVVHHAEHTAVDLNGSARLRVVSQIVSTGNRSFIVESLYGADGENPNGEVTVGSAMKEGSGLTPGLEMTDDDDLCVICLTNLKDTSVMPCRHMCLCKDCGESLLKHTPVCPVCRAPIATLLHKPK